MRTRIIVLSVLAFVGACLGLLAMTATKPVAKSAPAPVPVRAPLGTDSLYAASFTDTQGKVQPVSQWRNQVAIVNFWATWCPPCREEMPELSLLQDKYRASGLVVLGISTDDATKMQQFAREMPVSYPLLAGDFDTLTLASALGDDRDVLPYTLLLRRDGSIAASYYGRLDMQVLERDLRPLLDAKT